MAYHLIQNGSAWAEPFCCLLIRLCVKMVPPWAFY